MNEIAVTLSCYMLFAYANLIHEMSDLVLFGWVSIGIMGMNVILNLFIMACISCL